MKPFRFRLRKVHELRERAEKQAMEGVGLAQRQVAVAERHLDSLLARRAEIERDLTRRLEESDLSAAHLQRLHQDLEGMEAPIAAARNQVTEAEWHLDKARQVARNSRIARRATESLREKALERHNEDVRRAEQKDMDETASRRHVRGGSGS